MVSIGAQVMVLNDIAWTRVVGDTWEEKCCHNRYEIQDLPLD